MKDVLLTSSVLILAVLLVRALCRRSISRRMQYALWAVVLLRLLIPGNLPAVEFSVLSAARPVEAAVTQRVSVLLENVTSTTPDAPKETLETPSIPMEAEAQAESVPVQPEKSRSLSEILTWIWYGGMVVMVLWLVGTNLRFWLALRQRRTVYPVGNCPYRVYLVERGLSSPCLFGRAIYVTPAAVRDPETLRHVLVHETTHARHLDPLWSLLRSLCLVIYWFDPLVWLAACLSRQDCELACDEGALERLGEDQRIAYGQTLLSLIPVRRGGDLLLSATTMTSDKKRLKARILRIAEHRKPVTAVLILAVAVVAAACAVTFTGCKEQGRASSTASSHILTGGELGWFNETFFRDYVYEDDGTYINLRNQFLNSVYETPEDIDLYALFYCGLGRSTEEASAALTGDEPRSDVCPVDRLPRGDLDAALLENTGLTLAETSQVGLDGFQYLDAYDAYYHVHGDTNYRTVTIRWGEQAGDRVRLYYEGGDGWMCVTLEDRGEGNYWFCSNLPCEQPAMPLLLPDGDPALTISLAELEPLKPVKVETVPVSGDLAQRGGGVQLEDGTVVRTYFSTDGHNYAAVVHTDSTDDTWSADRFFIFPDSQGVQYGDSLCAFSDLFGQSGVRILYTDEAGPVYDYYAVSKDGQASLLLRAHGGDVPALLDLNGDSKKELLTSAGLFFEKDGQLYEADVPAILAPLWPEFRSLEGTSWDENYRALRCWTAQYQWMVYFDGENLLVY